MSNDEKKEDNRTVSYTQPRRRCHQSPLSITTGVFTPPNSGECNPQSQRYGSVEPRKADRERERKNEGKEGLYWTTFFKALVTAVITTAVHYTAYHAFVGKWTPHNHRDAAVEQRSRGQYTIDGVHHHPSPNTELALYKRMAFTKIHFAHLFCTATFTESARG